MNTKQINNQGKANLYFAVIVIAILFTCCSCGSRKVSKSKTETKELTESTTTKIDSSKTVTTIDSNIKVTDFGTTDEFTITPLDNTKEMVVNSIKYKNAVLKHKKTKANKVFDKSDKVAKTVQNDVKTDSKDKTSKTATTNTKNSDKQQYDWTKIIITIAIVLSIACWLIYFFYFRKAKNVNEMVV